MNISHKIEFVEGDFDTKNGQITAVMNRKYGCVNLCFKANMNVPFAKIKLHTRDLAIDADEVVDSAFDLADEIARRFNEFPEELKR